METPDYCNLDVHSVTDAPQGRFTVFVVPQDIDPNRPYGPQLLVDLFTPKPEEPLNNGNGGSVYEGILGDPSDGDPATLTIYDVVRRQNRQRKVAAGMGAAAHHPEGTLLVIPNQ